ncbi:hypothetical protein BB561_004890 [Smittium simulii]|uniref:Reverse transcriptase domain-containing protein n=1 Tax=Smittium simulii TaxID=133385 RepID=A0A2T9YDH7_9FUNG|nr:hypothetical protein BB561_004890 [Smittium simulii]
MESAMSQHTKQVYTNIQTSTSAYTQIITRFNFNEIRKDPNVLCVKTTLATAKFLIAIALSRHLMPNSIRLVSIPPDQCPPGTEALAKTWVCFIDYAKTYNKPIQKFKDNSRVGNQILPTVSYRCSLQQGCPLSPMLFNMYINDIFGGVDGVYVPALDDSVVLAEYSDKLQIALDVITKWSDIHKMPINAGKCIVIPVNYTWKYNRTIKNNKQKISNAMYGSYNFLKNQKILSAIRLKVLHSALIPIGTYGGELFGMSKFCIKPIQIIADRALREISGVNTATAIRRLWDTIN